MQLTGYEPEPLTPRLIAMQEPLLNLLHLHHANNPIISAEIERQLHLRGVDVRNLIQHLRAAGQPIASGGKGYYMAASAGELDVTIQHLEERMRALYFVASSLKRCRHELATGKRQGVMI